MKDRLKAHSYPKEVQKERKNATTGEIVLE